MLSRARSVALLSLAVAAACGGPGANEQVQARFQGHCNALVPNQETVDQASADIGFAPNRQNAAQAECLFTDANNGWELPSGNHCPNAVNICQIVWQVFDSALCSGSTGGCVYACLAYTAPADGATVDGSTPICGAKYVSGQAVF